MPGRPAALLFDVFGTCVDWRSGVARAIAACAARHGVPLDAPAFADRWRGLYQPSMEEVRSGRRPWAVLDVLHRESLDVLLPEHGLGAVRERERADLVRAWHRLDPWPDVVPGLERLRRDRIVAPFSNGGVALLVAMARRAGLPWDLILCAETSRAYKPRPESYLRALEMLALAPSEAMMVACHEDDLAAARSVGMATAFVRRPAEFGTGGAHDDPPPGAWDLVVDDLGALADALGG